MCATPKNPSTQDEVDLLCLGVGCGSSQVLRGVPSTSFVIRHNGVPILLVDCGAGVARAYRERLGEVPPEAIYITHNHLDHSGDLPVFLLSWPAPRPSVLGHAQVLEIVRRHRFHDAPTVQRSMLEATRWVSADRDGVITLRDLDLKLFQSDHSYLCYGFLLSRDRQPLLGYPSDSGFDEQVLDQALQAPVVLLDGRADGNRDHASFEQLEGLAERFPDRQIHVVHHEDGQRYHSFAPGNIRFLQPGDSVPLSAGR